MSRKGWVYTSDGRCIEKGSDEHAEYLGSRSQGVMIAPDDVEFVSPIDRKVYSGRAGMREHNKIHNVVSNRDLTGLPPMTTHRPPPPQTRERREQIIQIARQKGYI